MIHPKISIIVPVYNVEKYLKRCVDSLLHQTLTDIEVILVDDGSPDHCPAMCDEYARQDSRVKVIHKKNAGQGFARNDGLKIATGEFAAFVDSDDFADVTLCEKLLLHAKENKLDTCYCRCLKYYPSGKIKPIPELAENKIFSGRSEVDTFLMEMVGGEEYESGKMKYSVSVCKALYSAALIKKHRISFLSEREIASEDLFFNIDYLSRAEKVGWLNEMLYFYFANMNSTTTTHSEKMLQTVKAAMSGLAPYLSKYYPYDYYIDYCNAQLFRFQKYIFFREVIRKDITYKQKRNILYKECNKPVLYFLKDGYKINKLPFRKKIYVLCVKYKFVDILYLLIKAKTGKQ